MKENSVANHSPPPSHPPSLSPQEQGLKVEEFSEEEEFDPEQLKEKYVGPLKKIIQKKTKQNQRENNAYQYVLKVFFDNLPDFPDKEHAERLIKFYHKPTKDKSRLQVIELFGTGQETPRKMVENELNRRILRRSLIKNYDNLLVNKHISNKRLYFIFCKKMLMRLNKPQLIDTLNY